METRVGRAESAPGRYWEGSGGEEKVQEPVKVLLPDTDFQHGTQDPFVMEEKIQNDREVSKTPLVSPTAGALNLKGEEKVRAPSFGGHGHQGSDAVNEPERSEGVDRQDGVNASGTDVEMDRKWNIQEGDRSSPPPRKPIGQLNIDIVKQYQSQALDANMKLNELSPTKPLNQMNIPPSFGSAGQTVSQQTKQEGRRVAEDQTLLSVPRTLSPEDHDPRCDQALDVLQSNSIHIDSSIPKSCDNGSVSKNDGGSEEKSIEKQNNDNETSEHPGLFRSLSAKLADVSEILFLRHWGKNYLGLNEEFSLP